MRLTIVLVAAALIVPTLALAEAPLTAEDQLRAAARDAIIAHGGDPALFFAAPVELVTLGADGVETRETMTFDALLSKIASGLPAPTVVPGGPRVTAGDFLHIYLNVRVGNALGYAVRQSAVVPATPPVVLPPPATILAYDAGGPLRQVTGSYLVGLHSVGTLVGSNADTQGNLPVVNAGLVSDGAIDFTGHAQVAQGQACIFGLCIASGTMLATGVSAWDRSAPAPTPAVP